MEVKDIKKALKKLNEKKQIKESISQQKLVEVL